VDAFKVEALIDGVAVGAESVIATLKPNPIGYEIAPPGSATVTINDAASDPVPSPWDVVVERRTWDPLDGLGREQTGVLQLAHGLDLDLSPGTAASLDTALVYHSDRVDVRPVLQLRIPTPAGAPLPPQLTVELTWDAGPGGANLVSSQSFPTTGFSPGQLLYAAVAPAAAVAQTGR
jgi:hypothetical protein